MGFIIGGFVLLLRLEIILIRKGELVLISIVVARLVRSCPFFYMLRWLRQAELSDVFELKWTLELELREHL